MSKKANKVTCWVIKRKKQYYACYGHKTKWTSALRHADFYTGTERLRFNVAAQMLGGQWQLIIMEERN